jgi:hypothetical protein
VITLTPGSPTASTPLNGHACILRVANLLDVQCPAE